MLATFLFCSRSRQAGDRSLGETFLSGSGGVAGDHRPGPVAGDRLNLRIRCACLGKSNGSRMTQVMKVQIRRQSKLVPRGSKSVLEPVGTPQSARRSGADHCCAARLRVQRGDEVGMRGNYQFGTGLALTQRDRTAVVGRLEHPQNISESLRGMQRQQYR